MQRARWLLLKHARALVAVAHKKRVVFLCVKVPPLAGLRAGPALLQLPASLPKAGGGVQEKKGI